MSSLRSRSTPLGTTLLLTISTALSAQTSSERSALLAFHDSAQAATTVEGVKSLRAQPRATGLSRDIARLREGFIQLRMGELSGKRRALNDAGDAFAMVSERHDDWPIAWYGIGLTERALARAKAAVLPSRFHPLGFDYNQGAAMSFMRALDQNRGFVEATEGLADAVQATTRGGIARVSLAALNKADALSPRAMMVRARLTREVGDRDEALSQFQQALAAGYDPGVSHLEIARELFYAGDAVAANRSYWAGVAAARSPEAVEMVIRQLSFVAAPEELEGLAAVAADVRYLAVQRFWTRREVDAGLQGGERLREHYARYEVAHEAYAPINQGMTPVRITPARRMLQSSELISLVDYRTSTSGGYVYIPSTDRGEGYLNVSTTAYERENRVSDLDRRRRNNLVLWDNHLGLLSPWKNLDELDARGVTYLRYGAPDDFAGSFWAYHRAHGDLIVPVDHATVGSYCDLDGRYCRYEMDSMPTEVRLRWQRSLLAAWDTLSTTDRMIRTFPARLTPVMDAYGLLDDGHGSGRLLVAFAVPAWEIEPDSVAEGFVYPIRFQMIAAPPSGAYRLDRDTTRFFRSERRLGRGDYLQGTEVIDAPAAGYRVRIAVQTRDGQRGAVLGSDSAHIDVSRRGVAMSNLILGRDESGLTWWSGTDRVRLNPSGRIRRNEVLYLYYQTAGLTPGDRYNTSIEVFKATDADGTPLMTLGFVETAEGATAESERLVGLQQLNAGIHTIRVTIRDLDGTVLSQQHASVRVE